MLKLGSMLAHSSGHRAEAGALWRYVFLGAALAPFVASEPAMAQEPAAKNGATAAVSVELNKLEKLESGCRAYVVVDNKTSDAFKTLKLDLVLFKPDGVIKRRFAIDLAPLRKSKRAVKLFDLSGIACTDVGSLLINDVLECRGNEGPIEDCLSRMTVTSLTKASLSK